MGLLCSFVYHRNDVNNEISQMRNQTFLMYEIKKTRLGLGTKTNYAENSDLIIHSKLGLLMWDAVMVSVSVDYLMIN